MTTRIDDGGPAYPVITSPYEDGVGYGHWEGGDKWQFGGMTLRDAFAMAAMQGDLAGSAGGARPKPEELAEFSFAVADAMLRARSKGEPDAP